MSTETKKKKGTPQILRTDTAFKLAEKWVSNMSKSADVDHVEPEQEARPHRLGLGAKVSRETKRKFSDDPLDQKLQAKIDAGRRKHARALEESAGSGKNVDDDSEDDDDESESKSQAFGKKKKDTTSTLP